MKRRDPIIPEASQADKPSQRAAPLIIFAAIVAIGICTVATVLIHQCNTGQRFDEMVPAREIEPGVFINPEHDLRPKAQQHDGR